MAVSPYDDEALRPVAYGACNVLDIRCKQYRSLLELTLPVRLDPLEVAGPGVPKFKIVMALGFPLNAQVLEGMLKKQYNVVTSLIAGDPLVITDRPPVIRDRLLYMVSWAGLVTFLTNVDRYLPPTIFDTHPFTPADTLTVTSLDVDIAKYIANLAHRCVTFERTFGLARPDISWRVLVAYAIERAGLCYNFSGSTLRYALACGTVNCYRNLRFLYELVRIGDVRVVRGSPTMHLVGESILLRETDRFSTYGRDVSSFSGFDNVDTIGFRPFIRLRAGGSSGLHSAVTLSTFFSMITRGPPAGGRFLRDEVVSVFDVMRACERPLRAIFLNPAEFDRIYVNLPVMRLLYAQGARSDRGLLARSVDRFAAYGPDARVNRNVACGLYGRTVFSGNGTTPENMVEGEVSVMMGEDRVSCPLLYVVGRDLRSSDRDVRQLSFTALAGCRGAAQTAQTVTCFRVVNLLPLLRHPLSGVIVDHPLDPNSIPTGVLFNAVRDIVRTLSCRFFVVQPNTLELEPGELCGANVSDHMLVLQVNSQSSQPPQPTGLHLHPAHVGPLSFICDMIQGHTCSAQSCFAIAKVIAKGWPLCPSCAERDAGGGPNVPVSNSVSSSQALGVSSSLYAGATFDWWDDSENNLMPSGVSAAAAFWFRNHMAYAREHRQRDVARARERQFAEDGIALMANDRQSVFYLAIACLISKCLIATPERVTVFPPTDRMGVFDPPASDVTYGSLPLNLLDGGDHSIARIHSRGGVFNQVLRYASERMLDIIVSYEPRTRYGVLTGQALARSGRTLPRR